MPFRQAVALLACLHTLASGARLAGEAYNGVRVRMSPDIPENKQQEVLQLTQELLKSTSQSLHKTLGLSIGEVILEVPLSWTVQVQNYDDIDVGLSSESPDVDVTSSSDSVFGRIPHAVQYGGCGTAGMRIILPTKFLLEENPVPAVDKGKLMAREWIKYRYGVFDENGFPGDVRYPTYYKPYGETNVSVTGCSDNEISYKYWDGNGMNCDLEVEPNTNLPNPKSDCTFEADAESNGNVTSSLMNLQTLKNVDFLCGDADHPHRADSPNKQNVLCRNKSIWNILKKHVDFTNERVRNREFPIADPVFQIVKEKKNRIAVAIDAYSGLSKYNILIRNAVANLIYSLPPNSEFGVTTSKATSVQILPTSESKLNDYIDTIAITYREPDVCPGCAIEKAIQMLSDDSQKGGTVVLISSENMQNIDAKLINNLKTSRLRMIAIQLTNDTNIPFTIESSRLFDGTMFTIPGKISLTTLDQLYEAVEDAVQAKTYTQYIKLYAAQLQPNSPWTFVVDRTITNFRMWLSGTSTDQLYEIDQDDVGLVSSERLQQDIRRVPARNFFVLEVQSPTSSKWTCTLHNKSPLFVKITGALGQGDRIEAKAWTQDTTTTDSSYQMSWVIQASLSMGIHPIIDAKVEALITTPDGTKIIVSLYDNGLGDPDVTKNDGLYSKYFIQFTTPGQYEILVTFTDNEGQAKVAKPGSNVPVSCCGSSTITGEAGSVGSFNREVKYHYTARGQPPKNGYPPSTILDLRVTKGSESLYTLIFSAPGGEKDEGNADKYVLKQSRSYEDLGNNVDVSKGFVVNSVLTNPKSYGETEEIAIHVTDETLLNTTYFLSVISVNKNGEKSDFSNIVKIFLPSELPVIPTPSPTTEAKKGESLITLSTIGYIVGIISIIVLVVVGYIIFYFWTKRKKMREADTEPKECINSNGMAKKNDTDDDGSVMASEWHLDRDPISPVNSVPAAVLMHHHAQVKDAKQQHREPPLFKLEDLKNNDLQTIFKNIGGDLNTCFEEDEEVELSIEDDVPNGSTFTMLQPIKYSGRVTKV